MALLARKKAIYLGLESTYATEATIVGANVMDTENLSLNAIDGPVVQRNRDRPNLGGDARIPVGEFVSFSFEIPLAGSGTVDVAPKYAPALEMCGFDAPEITVATDVEMDLIGASATIKSATLWFEHDGQQHKILGARGSTEWRLSPGGLPRIVVTGQGLFVSPTSVAGLTPDYTGWQNEIAVNDANVPTCTLHGENVVVSDLSFNENAVVAYRNVINGEEVVLADWDFTGQITFDAPAISVKDWFSVHRNATVGTFQYILGATAGAIVQVACAVVQMQITNTYGASPEGISQLQANLFCLNTTPQKDFVLTTK